MKWVTYSILSPSKNQLNSFPSLKKDRLIKPETLSALSNLVSGMIHDFNDTLTAILDRIQSVLTEMEGIVVSENTGENVLKWLKDIELVATSEPDTAKHLQVFAKTFQAGSEKGFEELDINTIVREAVEVSKPRSKDEAKLEGIKMETERESF